MGQLEGFADGGRRKITIASIKRYVAERCHQEVSLREAKRGPQAEGTSVQRSNGRLEIAGFRGRRGDRHLAYPRRRPRFGRNFRGFGLYSDPHGKEL
jgi:hypothetical protein